MTELSLFDLEPLENFQDSDDIGTIDTKGIIVYSRDWTIETILNQIEQGNIELNPRFQRRNAWTDEKRSMLIDSILKGYPIPEIVLAEDLRQRNSFIVIDGKQRLMTIAGFKDHSLYNYWDIPKAKNIVLNGHPCSLEYDDLARDKGLLRDFNNSSFRCTVITNYREEDVLYDIFFRLNAGSTPLSTQELRQALNQGPFSDYLIDTTNQKSVLHDVMGLDGADRRLRDVEVLLRLMAFVQFGKDYNGNLKAFLDHAIKLFNNQWEKEHEKIIQLYDRIIASICALGKVFGGDFKRVGRKFINNEFESRFNRVILEIQVFYFIHLNETDLSVTNNQSFIELFKQLCQENASFRSSIEGSTKSIENYRVRYRLFQEIINNSYAKTLAIDPFN